MIRDMQLGDLAPASEIIRACFGDRRAEEAKRQMRDHFKLHNSRPHFYVAEVDERVVGLAGFRSSWIIPNAYELVWIAVAPEHQRKGIGHELNERWLEEVDRKGASLALLMTKQIQFFERFGFRSLSNMDGWTLMVYQMGKVAL